MSSTTECRFGWECRRPDCWFAHPNGRQVNNDPPPGAPVIPGAGMMMGPMGIPLSVGLGMPQPVMNGMAPSAITGGGGGGSGSGGGRRDKSNVAECRYGRSCHRQDCWFSHPDGRNIDDNPSTDAASSAHPSSAASVTGEYDDEEDEVLDQIEAAQSAGFAYGGDEEVCPCCNGNPRNCSNPDCQAQGICGCSFGMDDAQVEQEADDSWRDEWFPGRSSCTCCGGHVYRCKHNLPGCDENSCECHKQASSFVSSKPTQAS